MRSPQAVADHPLEAKEVHLIWMTTGFRRDGDLASVTGVTLSRVGDVVRGAIPGLPKVHLHNPVLAGEVGDGFTDFCFKAAGGQLDPFILVLEGSVPGETIRIGRCGAARGADPDARQCITANKWIDRLAPRALAIVCAGTCATYGEAPGMADNPTGLADYLGRDWRSKAGLPIVNVPGCPAQPDEMTETLLYLLYQVAGLAPMIPLDDQFRPTWLFGKTVPGDCDRGGHYEQADSAHEYGSSKCLVKIGAWGPVVNCNVTKRGRMDGPDGYGALIRSLRAITNRSRFC